MNENDIYLRDAFRIGTISILSIWSVEKSFEKTGLLYYYLTVVRDVCSDVELTTNSTS